MKQLAHSRPSPVDGVELHVRQPEIEQRGQGETADAESEAGEHKCKRLALCARQESRANLEACLWNLVEESRDQPEEGLRFEGSPAAA
jgi:hypothetical protein